MPHTTSPSSSSTTTATTQLSPSNTFSIPVLVDFLQSVPPPITTVLVALAPLFSVARHFAEIVSWRKSRHRSWVAVAAWWALCLLWVPGIRFLIPLLVVCTLAILQWKSWPQYHPAPVTEHTLQTTISDLFVIHALLPSPPSPPNTTLSPKSLLRISLILYVPYLILTHLVAIPTLLGIAGTLLLTHRAPWATTLRRILWSSAHVRWTLYTLWSLLSGTPLPPPLAPPPASSPAPALGTPGTAIRFLFTIYENQRWWVGLDWTAALLPSERPSWCSDALQPVSPPNAFALPPDTAVVVRDADGGRVRHTARWAWEDGEWRVVVKRDGASAAVRVERPLPPRDKDDTTTTTTATTGTGLSGFGSHKSRSSMIGEDEEPLHVDSGTLVGEDDVTDPDGWIYGDNKWESLSSKGGIGKYTRFRRWTRYAVLHEIAVTLSPSEPDSPVITTAAPDHAEPGLPTLRGAVSVAEVSQTSPEPHAAQSDRATHSEDGDRLRRRLRHALHLES